MMKIYILCMIIPLCAVELVGADYAQVIHKTMWADFLFYDKRHQGAQEWYTQVVAETTLPYPLRSYALLLFGTGQYATLLQHKNMLDTSFGNDIEVQRALALSLVHERHDAEAEKTFLALIKKFPTAYEIAIPAAQILMRRGDNAQAQEVLEKIVHQRTQKVVSVLAQMLLAQSYMKTGNKTGARELLMHCTTLQPSYAPAWLLLGAVEELLGNYQAALGAYRSFSALSPVRVPEVEKQIQVLTMRCTDPTMHALHTHKQQIQAYMAQQRYADALVLIKELLIANPEDAYARALYVHNLVTTEQNAAAIALLVRYIQQNPDDYRWWGALHILVLNPQSHARAYATLQTLQRTYPHILWGYLYCGDCYLRMEQYADAHALYAQALLCTQQAPVRAELYFLQALCGYELDDYTRVERAITQGLACACVHAPLYNIAAYYYAHVGAYEKALNLSKICCALEPQNYHYQDTALFIAYKKGEFSRVVDAYAQLHAKYPNDATIALHSACSCCKRDNKKASVQLLAHASNHAYSQYEKRRIQACLAK